MVLQKEIDSPGYKGYPSIENAIISKAKAKLLGNSNRFRKNRNCKLFTRKAVARKLVADSFRADRDLINLLFFRMAELGIIKLKHGLVELQEDSI